MAVKNVWCDEELFCVELTGEGWGVMYSFPVSELAQGASLSRMMNLKVRETLKANGNVVSNSELKEVAKEGVTALRGIVEPYFEARGYGQ